MEQIQNKAVKIEMVKVCDLVPNTKNPNRHSDEQIDRLCEIIKYQGFRDPLIVSTRSGYIVSGHGRLMAAKKLGIEEVPVTMQDFEDEDQEYAAIVSENSIASWAELDLSSINAQIPEFDPSFNIDLLGIKDFVIEPADKMSDGEKSNPKLADRFLVPPFSILDSRQGYWQDRKRQWLALGIKSEIGRGGASVAHQSQEKLWELSRQTK